MILNFKGHLMFLTVHIALCHSLQYGLGQKLTLRPWLHTLVYSSTWATRGCQTQCLSVNKHDSSTLTNCLCLQLKRSTWQASRFQRPPRVGLSEGQEISCFLRSTLGPNTRMYHATGSHVVSLPIISKSHAPFCFMSVVGMMPGQASSSCQARVHVKSV